jgi:hypothetical protein
MAPVSLGSKMIFVSDRSGNKEIYIADLSAAYEMSNIRRLTSDGGDYRHPVWQPQWQVTYVDRLHSLSPTARSGMTLCKRFTRRIGTVFI